LLGGPVLFQLSERKREKHTQNKPINNNTTQTIKNKKTNINKKHIKAKKRKREIKVLSPPS